MRYSVRQKLFVCTQLARNVIRNCVMFLAVFMHKEGCPFLSLFLCIIHGTSSFETVAGRLFEGRRSTVKHENFGRREQHFLGPMLLAALFRPS